MLGEDVGINGGVFRATLGLLDKFGAERVIDTPLDETTIAGITVGLAAQGMKPVAEAQFDGPFRARLHPNRSGRYYYNLTVEVQTLTETDLDALQHEFARLREHAERKLHTIQEHKNRRREPAGYHEKKGVDGGT